MRLCLPKNLLTDFNSIDRSEVDMIRWRNVIVCILLCKVVEFFKHFSKISWLWMLINMTKWNLRYILMNAIINWLNDCIMQSYLEISIGKESFAIPIYSFCTKCWQVGFLNTSINMYRYLLGIVYLW